jgi:hypothetical protein
MVPQVVVLFSRKNEAGSSSVLRCRNFKLGYLNAATLSIHRVLSSGECLIMGAFLIPSASLFRPTFPYGPRSVDLGLIEGPTLSGVSWRASSRCRRGSSRNLLLSAHRRERVATQVTKKVILFHGQTGKPAMSRAELDRSRGVLYDDPGRPAAEIDRKPGR